VISNKLGPKQVEKSKIVVISNQFKVLEQKEKDYIFEIRIINEIAKAFLFARKKHKNNKNLKKSNSKIYNIMIDYLEWIIQEYKDNESIDINNSCPYYDTNNISIEDTKNYIDYQNKNAESKRK